MQARALLISLLLLAVRGQRPTFSRCSQSIKNQIYNFWRQNRERPDNISQNKNLCVFILATPPTFPGAKCRTAQFGREIMYGSERHTMLRYNVTDQYCCSSAIDQPIRDVAGVIQDIDHTNEVVYLLDRAGVSCGYACNNCNTAPQGPVDAFIKVNPLFFNQNLVNRCIQAFAAFNPPIYLTTQFPLNCPCGQFDCNRQC